MTVGQALERAEELRPGSRIALSTRQAWLREADAMLRERFFKHSITDAYDDVGADLAWDDSLQDEDVLLAPAPFDAMYPHYLCAMTDAALGETDRYAYFSLRFYPGDETGGTVDLEWTYEDSDDIEEMWSGFWTIQTIPDGPSYVTLSLSLVGGNSYGVTDGPVYLCET